MLEMFPNISLESKNLWVGSAIGFGKKQMMVHVSLVTLSEYLYFALHLTHSVDISFLALLRRHESGVERQEEIPEFVPHRSQR